MGNWDALIREGKIELQPLPLILGSVLIHGAAGNVGAYAVQLAKQAGLHVVATAAAADLDYVRGLGAERVVDFKREGFEESLTGVDVVLDTVGGDTQRLCSRWKKLALPTR